MSVLRPSTMTWPWATIWRVAQMVRPTPRRRRTLSSRSLQDLHHRVGGVALGLLGDVQELAELLLEHAVVEAELLLFGQADAVLGVAAAAVAVHAGEGELLGGVLGDVGDGDPDAAGQLDLRTEVTAHGRESLSNGQTESSARLRTLRRGRPPGEGCSI